ncbi:hypothetical protein FQN57_000049 [Myotisia sp. PD_48]|nr:hypothetical protein FQN57_000049 [Myotisia sp. PD_48]
MSKRNARFSSRDRSYGSRHLYHPDETDRSLVSRRADSRSRSPDRRARDYSRRHRREYEKQEKSRLDAKQPRHDTPLVRETAAPVILPFNAGPLSKHDLSQYRSVFGMYLDIQKSIDINELDERELKGRWKSFVGKWNRGELAEGWYDQTTFEKAIDNEYETRGNEPPSRKSSRQPPTYSPYRDDDTQGDSSVGHRRDLSVEHTGRLSPHNYDEDEANDEDEDEDTYGPQAPIPQFSGTMQKSGPKIPTIEDLEIKRDAEREALEEARETQYLSHKQEKLKHKSELRAFEDEVAPRAEPGSRERRIEKKQERSAANLSFAESKRGGSPTEAVADADLLGGGDDLQSLRQVKAKQERKKNERELRKQEFLRARAAEREVRLRSYQQKEEETMSYLKAIAQERFG